MSIALIFTRLSAALGKKEDLYRLGVYHYEGVNGQRNLAKATALLQQATDKHYKKALYYLALIELEERGTEGMATALRFFELAKFYEPRANNEIKTLETQLLNSEPSASIAEQLFKIGYMYANDQAVFKNLDKAQHYWARAAEFGNTYAHTQLMETQNTQSSKKSTRDFN